jgi:hypothetical protein
VGFMDGGKALQQMIDALIQNDQAEKMMSAEI